MTEFELEVEDLSELDNIVNVEMTSDEISFLKTFIQRYNPKKIVEVGVSAGGNTVNLLRWKDANAKLFSIDIMYTWYRDSEKLSGFMADEVEDNTNWKIFRGYDYLDVCEEIGGDIDCIVIDTNHVMPGEFLTFIAALPNLKDGCIVILHDIHLNMSYFSKNSFINYQVHEYCTGLLFGGVSSNKKWILKSDIPNIGAFVVDKSTRDNIKDIFHILCTSWFYFPTDLNIGDYSEYVNKNYSVECYNLFNTCLKLQSDYINHGIKQKCRIDIKNKNKVDNTIEILKNEKNANIYFPDWFKTKDGKGAVVETNEQCFDLKFKCVNEGLLSISLKGQDIRDAFGKIERAYIDYRIFKINNEDIIEDNVIVWHDEDYNVVKNVKDGEIIEIHLEWTPIE